MSAPQELMDMTLEAHKQFEEDRARHIQLIEVVVCPNNRPSF